MFSLKVIKNRSKCSSLLYLFENSNPPLKNEMFHYSQSRVGLPSQAHVVIAGAGLVANSVAYHLAKSGWKDVLVLEQNKIASGTSDFESGIMGLFKPIIMRNLIMYSIELYKDLQNMGYEIELKTPGSIYLAQTKDRMIALKRRMAYNIPNGLHCEYLSPNEVGKLHPYLRTDDLEGAIWVPDAAVANPRAICVALSDLAKENGISYFENCAVQEICTENGHVSGVKSERGFINCEIFVNCAGMWSRELGLRCNPQVRIPAYPAEQFCVSTDQVVESNLPCVKDYDGYTYARESHQKLMVGWFEKEAKPAFGSARVPKDWRKHLHEDYKHLVPLWEKAVHRIPILKNASYTSITNTVDNFTPDGRWIIGESPEVKNYYVACGMNGNPLQGSGGIGKTLAEWIIEGRPTTDLTPFNIARFLDLHNNRQYLHQRTKEIVGRQFSILYPHQCEYKNARKLRCSPLYSVLEKRGAVFGIKMGYERALYFDTTKNIQTPCEMPPGSFYKPKFFDFMLKEYSACREGVGIIDMSSFSKVEISSAQNEAIDYLQNLCSNDVDIAIGGLVHTGMQNDKGGYENDCMLLRLGKSNYFMVSPTSQQTRIYDWMSRHLPNDLSVVLNDVTSKYTVINVVGPKSHELISELSGTDNVLSPYTYNNLDIGYASDIMVMGFTHTGEPGYCLYVPSEYALHVYDTLMKVGKDYGARDVGTLTQRFMRIERFIPFWAEELSSEVTPFEAGNGYRVKLDKGNFIGREALLLQKERGVTKKLVLFHLNDFDADSEVWPWGGEPIYRNNKYVGSITSAGFGFTTKKLVCSGFIRKPDLAKDDNLKKSRPEHIITDEYILESGAKYELDIAGHRVSLTPHIHPPYFPTKSYDKKTPLNPLSVNISKNYIHNLMNEI